MNTILSTRSRRPRNRFVSGCLMTFTVLGLLAAGLGWWFIGRPAQQAWNSYQQLNEAQPLEQVLVNRAAFSAPADGLLNAAQVDRFISAQEQMKGTMEDNLAALTARYEELGNRELQLTDLLTLGNAYRDYVQLLSSARAAQVNALNDHGFSAGEYRWVRAEVLRAAGWHGVGTDFEGIIGAMQGQQVRTGPVDTSPAPAANVELIESRQSDIQESAALVVFGL